MEKLPLERFILYESKTRYYLVGYTRCHRYWRLLKIQRNETAEGMLLEDECTYSEKEMAQILWRLSAGNEQHGGLKLVKRAYGVVGFVRFLKGAYLILITKRKRVGSLFGHRIYSVAGTTCVPISEFSGSPTDSHTGTAADERRYLRLFMSLDLCKDFYFSNTYPLWNTLQKNMTTAVGDNGSPFDNMFVWNVFLATELCKNIKKSEWIIPLIHGFFKQVTLSTFGKNVTLTLLARRSRYFAGTRFLKRGMNDLGQVANEVETEQIVDGGKFRKGWHNSLSSVVQVRGSIPLYWSQETNPLNPKPEIVLQRYDPSYMATRYHFDSLIERYGKPVIILNLIKSFERRPREMVLRVEFAQAVDYLNKYHYKDEEKLLFVHWDFSKCTKQRGVNVLAAIRPVVTKALESTGVFFAIPTAHKKVHNRSTFMKQNGVLRTNCIDCLDRTNVAQFAYGLHALEHQLYHLGMAENCALDPRSEVAKQLMNLYEAMGNCVALQYGGSEAHSVFFKRQKGNWEASTQSKDLMTSFRRFYSNTLTDSAKQDAMNLFLGYFVPEKAPAHIWELDSDIYLPNLYYQGHYDLSAEWKVPDAKSKDTVVDPNVEKELITKNLELLCHLDEDENGRRTAFLSSFDKIFQQLPSRVNVQFCGQTPEFLEIEGAADMQGSEAPDSSFSQMDLSSRDYLARDSVGSVRRKSMSLWNPTFGLHRLLSKASNGMLQSRFGIDGDDSSDKDLVYLHSSMLSHAESSEEDCIYFDDAYNTVDPDSVGLYESYIGLGRDASLESCETSSLDRKSIEAFDQYAFTELYDHVGEKCLRYPFSDLKFALNEQDEDPIYKKLEPDIGSFFKDLTKAA